MAGSYKHCTNDDGSFRDEDFTEMIENLGDAHEACEEMHFMIRWLAKNAPDYRYKVTNEAAMKRRSARLIKLASNAYYTKKRSEFRRT